MRRIPDYVLMLIAPLGLCCCSGGGGASDAGGASVDSGADAGASLSDAGHDAASPPDAFRFTDAGPDEVWNPDPPVLSWVNPEPVVCDVIDPVVPLPAVEAARTPMVLWRKAVRSDPEIEAELTLRLVTSVSAALRMPWTIMANDALGIPLADGASLFLKPSGALEAVVSQDDDSQWRWAAMSVSGTRYSKWYMGGLDLWDPYEHTVMRYILPPGIYTPGTSSALWSPRTSYLGGGQFTFIQGVDTLATACLNAPSADGLNYPRWAMRFANTPRSYVTEDRTLLISIGGPDLYAVSMDGVLLRTSRPDDADAATNRRIITGYAEGCGAYVLSWQPFRGTPTRPVVHLERWTKDLSRRLWVIDPDEVGGALPNAQVTSDCGVYIPWGFYTDESGRFYRVSRFDGDGHMVWRKPITPEFSGTVFTTREGFLGVQDDHLWHANQDFEMQWTLTTTTEAMPREASPESITFAPDGLLYFGRSAASTDLRGNVEVTAIATGLHPMPFLDGTNYEAAGNAHRTSGAITSW